MAQQKSSPKPVEPPADSGPLQKILERGRKGDESALPEIRAILDKTWRLDFFDLGRNTEASLIKAILGKDLVLGECLRRQVEALRRDLAGPEPTPLERLLVDRIVLCWLWVQYAEAIYAQNHGELTLTRGDFHQRRLDRVHRRYLSAIKALAQVRKLQLPAVQVNIGAKQINVVETPTTHLGE